MSLTSKPSARQIGKAAEQDAYDYLIQQGLRPVEKNYSCKLGEIDLIMKDRETLVFIEVRYRTREEYGDALASVTLSKQRKIIRTAQYYLQQENLYDQIACRFDVITPVTATQKFHWIKDAFGIRN